MTLSTHNPHSNPFSSIIRYRSINVYTLCLKTTGLESKNNYGLMLKELIGTRL